MLPRRLTCAGWAVALLLGGCRDFGTFRSASVVQSDQPLAPGSCSATTRLTFREPPPAEAVGGQVAADVTVTSYPSNGLELRAWTMRPPGEGPFPALVFLHGGFAWSPAHAEMLRPWVDAGWFLMMPALRGENGNPGTYELLCGEVDDAEAAVRWVAARPDVDPARIAVFGHSLGGGVSGLLALRDLPIAASGSAGGLYFEEVLAGWGPMLPFDPNDPVERRKRLVVAHLGELRHPHHAWIGRGDVLHAIVEPARAKATELHAPLTILDVDGDHQTALGPALDAFRSLLSSGPAKR